MKKEIKYQITENVGCVSQRGEWSLELNLVSWNDGSPKYDLRSWNEDHSKMSRGLTFTLDEIRSLRTLLNQNNV